MSNRKNAIARRLDSRDKRLAAIHEAGHATTASIICWDLGRAETQTAQHPELGEITLSLGFVRAHLRRTETTNPDLERKWVGSTDYGCIDLRRDDKATICVAGMIAERLTEESDVSAEDIIMDWKSGGCDELSETDLHGIPTSWKARSRAVSLALQMLRDKRKVFNQVVRRLVRNDCVTNHQLEQLLAKAKRI